MRDHQSMVFSYSSSQTLICAGGFSPISPTLAVNMVCGLEAAIVGKGWSLSGPFSSFFRKSKFLFLHSLFFGFSCLICDPQTENPCHTDKLTVL